MKNKNMYLFLMGALILGLSILIWDRPLTVFKASFIEEDLKVENLVLVSNGHETYIASSLVFENISTQNIKDVKCFVRKGDKLILDLLFQMDGLKKYEVDVERYLKEVGFNKRDQLSVTLEYKINDRVRKETYLMKVADYLRP